MMYRRERARIENQGSTTMSYKSAANDEEMLRRCVTAKQ